MMENWRAVVDFEGLYEVSDLGRVRSLDRTVETSRGKRTMQGQMMRTTRHIVGCGYFRVCLYKNNKTSFRRVHRMVLEAFVGPAPAGMIGCHDDGDNVNNRLSNLRWDTHQANMDDRVGHGTYLCGETAPRSKLSAGDVIEIREAIGRGQDQRALAAHYGVCPSTITHIKAGRSWRSIE